MSGFSPDWLALREPADHRARNTRVRDAALACLPGTPRIVDLGCGTGSNLRALAPFLPNRQSWRLVDHDPRLLAAARQALSAWADQAEPGADGDLQLRHGVKNLTDLAGDFEAVLDVPADLVTSAAFFDLVAGDWIARFCAALVARRLPLFTVLTYDGTERWQPPHPMDAAVLSAFHAHQAGDKGFGPAAGPRAGGLLGEAFAAAAWTIVSGESPWRLNAPDDAALIGELAGGIATAVAETGRLSASDLDSWRAARTAAEVCEIGHLDFFAAPKTA